MRISMVFCPERMSEAQHSLTVITGAPVGMQGGSSGVARGLGCRRKDDHAMGEIVDDVERLRGGALDVETCAGDIGGDVALLLNAMTVDQRERLEAMDREVMRLIDSMGGSKHRYARERRGSLKK